MTADRAIRRTLAQAAVDEVARSAKTGSFDPMAHYRFRQSATPAQVLADLDALDRADRIEAAAVEMVAAWDAKVTSSFGSALEALRRALDEP